MFETSFSTLDVFVQKLAKHFLREEINSLQGTSYKSKLQFVTLSPHGLKYTILVKDCCCINKASVCSFYLSLDLVGFLL